MAKATELERCPKCGRFQVYARHDMKTDMWDIHCDCGFGTKEFKTWRLARRSWNKMKEQLRGNEE